MTVPVGFPAVVAVTVNAPAAVPARRVIRAMPLQSVSTVPDAGLNLPVVSEVLKVTAMFGAGWPLASLTRAWTIPGLAAETVFTEFPAASVSVTVMLDCPGVVVPQFGRSGFRFGSGTQVLLSPPPP